MPIPAILAQLLVMIGLQLADALGKVIARQIQGRFAVLAEKNPTLDQEGLKDAANLIAELAEGVTDEVRTFTYGNVWTDAEVKQFMRERSWREIVERAATRKIVVTENTARRAAEEALEAKKAVPILTPEDSG